MMHCNNNRLLLSSFVSRFLSYNIILLFTLLLSGCEAFIVTNNLPFRRANNYNGRNIIIDFSSSSSSSLSSTGRLDFCYKRLGKSSDDRPYVENKKMSTIQIAEDIENELQILIDQRNTTDQAYIASLDGWMVAYNRNNRDAIYGERMEDVLQMMEKEQQLLDNISSSGSSSSSSVDAYACVIHLWLSAGEVFKALRVLSWMETNDEIINRSSLPTKRLIQYNRVLQGLIRSNDDTNYCIAIQLLESMYNQSDFEIIIDDAENEMIQFKVSGVLPNTKSFTTVIEPLLKKMMTTNDDNQKKKNEELLLIKFMKKAKELDVLSDFLMKKINKGIKDKETMNFLLQRSQV